ncbi:hypothetical protein A2U01_0047189, partial [Trifolium medium]|nr:hypothetical protein [Trifolium medium]
SRKNTDFKLEGVDYGLSPYIFSVWGSETMSYIISQGVTVCKWDSSFEGQLRAINQVLDLLGGGLCLLFF